MLYSHEDILAGNGEGARSFSVPPIVKDVISSVSIDKRFWAFDATHAVKLAEEYFKKCEDEFVYIYYGRILIEFGRAQNDGEKPVLSVASVTDLSGGCGIVESHPYTAQQVEDQLKDALSIET